MVLAGALTVRERRLADPIVPLDLLRTRTVAVASAALVLTTAAFFAVNVFVPLFLQATTGASPTQAGLLLVPMMLGITVSTNVAGRAIARTGRYKRFPVAGLALMTVALVLLAVVAREPSRTTTGIGLALFGLGFGMVGRVLLAVVVLLPEVALRGRTDPPRKEQSVSTASPQSTILLRSEQSKHELGIVEVTVGAGWPGPPLHHHAFDEAFYVLDGELTFQLGDELATAGAGSLTFAPRGSHHTLANLGDADARYLLVCTPGGFERRFDAEASRPYPETIVVGPQIARR